MTTDTRDAKPTYDPNRLLDALKEILNIQSDLALAEVLEIPPLVISQLRHRGYPMAPSILIRMHEVSCLSIGEMRKIIGDRRKRVRTSYDMSYIDTPADYKIVAVTQVNMLRHLFFLVMAVLLGCIIWLARS